MDTQYFVESSSHSYTLSEYEVKSCWFLANSCLVCPSQNMIQIHNNVLWTPSILWSIPHIRTECGEDSVEYCQSTQHFSWIWTMLCCLLILVPFLFQRTSALGFDMIKGKGIQYPCIGISICWLDRPISVGQSKPLEPTFYLITRITVDHIYFQSTLNL